jgi:hypothetical protein
MGTLFGPCFSFGLMLMSNFSFWIFFGSHTCRPNLEGISCEPQSHHWKRGTTENPTNGDPNALPAIPTVTLLCHSFWHIAFIFWSFWHSIWHSILEFFLALYLAFYLTFYSDILFWHSVWHIFWHCFCIYPDIPSDILSGMLPSIFSDGLSTILSGIFSGIHFGILSGICSDVLFGNPSGTCSGPQPHSLWHRVHGLPASQLRSGSAPAVPTEIWSWQLKLIQNDALVAWKCGIMESLP